MRGALLVSTDHEWSIPCVLMRQLLVVVMKKRGRESTVHLASCPHGCDLLLQVLDQALVGFTRLKQCLNTVVRVIPVKFNAAPQATDLHPRAFFSPVSDDTLLSLKLIPATELAIRFEACQLAVFAHVLLKPLICEFSRAQTALEILRIQPRHHNVIDFVVESFSF